MKTACKSLVLTLMLFPFFSSNLWAQKKGEVKTLSKYDHEIVITPEEMKAAKSGDQLITYETSLKAGYKVAIDTGTAIDPTVAKNKEWDITEIVKGLTKKDPVSGKLSYQENGNTIEESFIIRFSNNSKSSNSNRSIEKCDDACKDDCKHPSFCKPNVKIINIDACLNECNGLDITCGTGCAAHKMTVRQNEMVAMRIKNINPLRYKYTISGTDVSLHQDGSDAFQTAYDNIKQREEEGSETDLTQNGDTGTFALALKEPVTAKTVIDSVNGITDDMEELRTDASVVKKELSEESCLSQKTLETVRGALLARLVALEKRKRDADRLKDDIIPPITSTQTVGLDTAMARYDRSLKKMKDELMGLYGLQLEVTTMPYQPKARNIDMINYVVERTEVGNEANKTSVDYNVFLRGGVKIDFSAGLFATGIYDRQYSVHEDKDNSYTVIADADTVQHREKYFLQKGTGDAKDGFVIPADFAVGSMMNVHTRFSEVWSLGGSVGLSTSLRGNFQLLLGGVITFGKFQRVSLHGGAAFGWYSDLKKGYKAYDDNDSPGETYQYTDSDAPITDRFGISWFAGISYNITKKAVVEAGENE